MRKYIDADRRRFSFWASVEREAEKAKKIPAWQRVGLKVDKVNFIFDGAQVSDYAVNTMKTTGRAVTHPNGRLQRALPTLTEALEIHPGIYHAEWAGNRVTLVSVSPLVSGSKDALGWAIQVEKFSASAKPVLVVIGRDGAEFFHAKWA